MYACVWCGQTELEVVLFLDWQYDLFICEDCDEEQGAGNAEELAAVLLFDDEIW